MPKRLDSFHEFQQRRAGKARPEEGPKWADGPSQAGPSPRRRYIPTTDARAIVAYVRSEGERAALLKSTITSPERQYLSQEKVVEKFERQKAEAEKLEAARPKRVRFKEELEFPKPRPLPSGAQHTGYGRRMVPVTRYIERMAGNEADLLRSKV